MRDFHALQYRERKGNSCEASAVAERSDGTECILALRNHPVNRRLVRWPRIMASRARVNEEERRDESLGTADTSIRATFASPSL
jgi:hypothetical protein